MKRIFYILIIGVIIVSLLGIIKNKDLINEKLPLKLLVVKSNSMFPNLEKNDVILIKKYNDYKVNDIITYNYENYLITHRIIEKNDEGFITKGDNNNSQDNDLVKLKDIKGKVILKINRKGKTILTLLLAIISIVAFFNNKEA